MNWREQAAASHYRTAVAIRDCIRHGDVSDAARGIEELIEALSRSDRRALKSQLIRLMSPVLKSMSQPELRTRSWVATIRGARKEIRDLQDETPSLTDEFIRGVWASCFETAKDQAEAEIDGEILISDLSWEDVFQTSYQL